MCLNVHAHVRVVKTQVAWHSWVTHARLPRFTGSAGTAVVTTDQALLWTDGRYFLQVGGAARDDMRRLTAACSWWHQLLQSRLLGTRLLHGDRAAVHYWDMAWGHSKRLAAAWYPFCPSACHSAPDRRRSRSWGLSGPSCAPALATALRCGRSRQPHVRLARKQAHMRLLALPADLQPSALAGCADGMARRWL